MKLSKVTSLFFLSILMGILNSSCNINYNKNDSASSLVTKKIDSIKAYYDIASQRSYSETRRLEAISNFINGALQLQIDSLYYEGLRLKSNMLYRYGDIEKAIQHSKIMLQYAQQNEDSLYIGKSYYKLGVFNKKQEKYLKAFDQLNKSFKIRRNLKDSINAGKCLQVLANIQRMLGDHNASKIMATDGLSYLKNSSEYNSILSLYHNISISFKELGNHEDALIWNNKILHLVKDSIILKKIGVNDMIIFRNTRANILAGQKKFTESIKILEELLKNKNVKNDLLRYPKILNNLGYIKFQKNPENSDSEKLLLQALQIRKETVEDLFSSHISLSKYYREKDSQKALYHAKKAQQSLNDLNDYEALLEALTLITELDPNSIEDHRLFKDVSLKLMEVRKKTREIYAPTRFENENLQKENEQKNKKISEVQNQNTIYLLGMLLLITLIGFVIYFSRQRTRYLAQQNKMVQFQTAYETETRISKRLHDELGNDIFQVMLQYQHDPHDPQIVEKLNKSYNKARDISRENSEFETDETYPLELKDMLQNYTQNNIQLILRGFEKIEWQAIDKNIKITVYRVLQELMTNMQKHSKADLVAIIFSVDTTHITIKYSDNGIGMTKEDLNQKNGLRNTEKRIQAIDGTLIFDSQKEKGFKASIQIPN